MNAQELAELIESLSQELSDEHYGLAPGQTRHRGGSVHNNDALYAAVVDCGQVRVTDLAAVEYLDPAEFADDASVREYVTSWLVQVWDSDEAEVAFAFAQALEDAEADMYDRLADDVEDGGG